MLNPTFKLFKLDRRKRLNYWYERTDSISIIQKQKRKILSLTALKLIDSSNCLIIPVKFIYLNFKNEDFLKYRNSLLKTSNDINTAIGN